MKNLFLKQMIYIILIILTALISSGFLSFIYMINSSYITTKNINYNSEHMIVATGGTNRLNHGLEIMKNKPNLKMLLTGVGEGVNKKDIAKVMSAKKWQRDILDCCVYLDTSAKNTKENAFQASKWLRDFQANSVYLVTANYHMPRLFLELKNKSPNIKIIPISVQADSKPLKNIWKPKNFSLLIIEFFKFITKKTYFSFSDIFNI